MKTFTLREWRERRELTQAELARLAGVDQSTVSGLETGRQANPTLNTQERLAKALGIAPSELRFVSPEPAQSVTKAKDRTGHTRGRRERKTAVA